MASAYVTATISPGVALFTTPLNQKAKLSAIDIDNGLGSAARTISIVDTFTPNAGVNNPTPSAQNKVRAKVTVPKGSFISLDESSLKDSECFGAVTAVADATDANCGIVVRYSLN